MRRLFSHEPVLEESRHEPVQGGYSLEESRHEAMC